MRNVFPLSDSGEEDLESAAVRCMECRHDRPIKHFNISSTDEE